MFVVTFDVFFHLPSLLLKMFRELIVDIFKKFHRTWLRQLFGFLEFLHHLLTGGLRKAKQKIRNLVSFDSK